MGRLSYSSPVEYARNSRYAGEDGYGDMEYHQPHDYVYGPSQFEHARHPPPGLPVPPPPARLPFHYDCTDLPTSDQTYGATGELLRVTPPKDTHSRQSYPYPVGEPSMYPPMQYDGNGGECHYPPMPTGHEKAYYPSMPYEYGQEAYYPHDNKENLPPRDSFESNPFPASAPVPTSHAGFSHNLQPRQHAEEYNLEEPRYCNVTRRLKPRRNKKNKPGRIPSDPDDDEWKDIDPADDPEDEIEAARRESQFSYANTSDAGDWIEVEDGGKCCMPSMPLYAQPELQACRMSDGTLGHPAREIMDPDEETTDPRRAALLKDVKYAVALIKEVLSEKQVKSTYAAYSERAGELRYNDMPEHRLQALKYKNEMAVQHAADYMAREVPNMRPGYGRAYHNGYTPPVGFLELMRKIDIVVADPRELPKKKLPPQKGMSELAKYYLNKLPTPESSAGSSPQLVYSETVGSFRTVTPEKGKQRIRTWINELEKPEPETVVNQPESEPALKKPEPVMTPGGRGVATPSDNHRIAITTPLDSERTGRADEYEMNELVRHNSTTNKAGKGRPAMSGQTSLRPLQLAVGNGNTGVEESSTTSFVPGRRLTNTELAQREPGWTMMSPESRSLPRTAFELPDNTPLLRRMDSAQAEAGGGGEVEKEKKAISTKYFAMAALCPVTAVLFGLGKFDSRARKVSKGRVDGMVREDKTWALWVAAPMGVIAYAIVVVVVIILRVVAAH